MSNQAFQLCQFLWRDGTRTWALAQGDRWLLIDERNGLVSEFRRRRWNCDRPRRDRVRWSDYVQTSPDLSPRPQALP